MKCCFFGFLCENFDFSYILGSSILVFVLFLGLFPVMSGGEMTNTQLMQQLALLRWVTSQTEEDRRLLAGVTGLQVGRELLNRITCQDRVDAYKRDCIFSIAEFVRQNPRASQAQINAEVENRVLAFAARVKALDSAPLF